MRLEDLRVGVELVAEFDGLSHYAAISVSCLGRYALWREWLGGEGTCLFVMLNPSTADASQDDPTIRRCIGFAQRWGYHRLAVGNLYGWRATKPSDLPLPGHTAVGELCEFQIGKTYPTENDEWLRKMALEANRVIVAWGAKPGPHPNRPARVVDLLNAHYGPVDALALTKDGHPRHPLYVRGDVEPVDFQLPNNAAQAAPQKAAA